ncbi:MAG: HEAT repeat domain-containing protein [Chloroflexi bacterium]|nr:HEAT repeat domain-containing protein [Chloroflexota bacterium]
MAEAPTEEEIEKLLQELANEETYRRKLAAEKLGELGVNNERIISALEAVVSNDPNRYVQLAARKALEALTHQSYTSITMPSPALDSSPASEPASGSNKRDFIAGFIGWFGVNGLLLCALLTFDISGEGSSAFAALVLLINIGLPIYFGFTRRRVAVGMLAAFAISLVLTAALTAACFSMDMNFH